MSTPRVNLSKQLRRIANQRRQRALLAIASMSLSEQMTLAINLRRLEIALDARKEVK